MNTEALFRLRSLTAALKAKKLLSANGFKVTTEKLTSKDAAGCVYVITVSGGTSAEAAALLRSNGINVI